MIIFIDHFYWFLSNFIDHFYWFLSHFIDHFNLFLSHFIDNFYWFLSHFIDHFLNIFKSSKCGPCSLHTCRPAAVFTQINAWIMWKQKKTKAHCKQSQLRHTGLCCQGKNIKFPRSEDAWICIMERLSNLWSGSAIWVTDPIDNEDTWTRDVIHKAIETPRRSSVGTEAKSIITFTHSNAV